MERTGEQIITDLCKWMDAHGSLATLRHGFKCYGRKLHVAFFKAAHPRHHSIGAASTQVRAVGGSDAVAHAGVLIMPKKGKASGSRRPKKPAGIEWIGGTVMMPAYVTGEGEPYRPEVLVWMGAEGAILGSTVAKPGELLPMASESLQGAIEMPMYGRPHAPTRVRVASAELADALRAGHPELDVVCAPTPELDEMLNMMREKMDEDGAAEQSYLSPDIGPDAMASFFQAAAGLFRAKPWKIVPSDQSLFSVTIEKLGVHDAAMSVIGQMGQSMGLVLFSGLDDFEAYLDAANAIEHGEEPEMPPHFALNFERGAELSSELRKEIAEHQWEVVAANAYPWLVAIDEDLVARPPTAGEVTMAAAIALALTNVLAEKKALRAAWKGGEPVSRTLLVDTHQGELEVTLCAPYMRAPVEFDPSHDLLADLGELAREDDEIDPDAREPLENELVRRFAASPEAKDLDEIQACRFVMDFAADYFGATIATLGSSELREIIFDIIPRKVSIDASEARWIIEESRAFYGFLKREYKLKQADSCLRALGGTAIKKLEAALSDSSNFGMAKSLFMAGSEAGFDMDTREGIEAWMQAAQDMPLPPSVRLPSLGEPPPAAQKAAVKAKKNKRKAARKRKR
jgi:Domain of unknown function (DUF6930)